MINKKGVCDAFIYGERTGVMVRDKIRGYVSDSIHILFVFVNFDGERRARRSRR